MKISDIDPDGFIASLEDEIGSTIASLDHTIREAMPNRHRVLWQGVFWGGTDQSIIGYGHIVQPRPKGEKVHWFLLGLARQKNNYSLYLNATNEAGDGYLAHDYADRLGQVKLGSASITFKKAEDLDLEALGELLRAADAQTPPDPTT